MTKYAKIYIVRCPYCGSGAGRPCHYINRHGMSAGVAPHMARIKASSTEAREIREQRFSLKARPAGPTLGVGDIVFHLNEELRQRLGRVVGFGLDPLRWIKVKTGDGKSRIWARQNLFLPEQDLVA